MPGQNSSTFERITGAAVNPIWMLRGFAIAAIVPLVLALFVFKSGGAHGFCVGLSIGTLVGLIVQLFSVKSVELSDTTRPADVDNLFVTR